MGVPRACGRSRISGLSYLGIQSRDVGSLKKRDRFSSCRMGEQGRRIHRLWGCLGRAGDRESPACPISEYNHGTSGALKNAIDFLHAEWANKAAGFIGYGGASGVRAIENLRLVLSRNTITGRREP